MASKSITRGKSYKGGPEPRYALKEIAQLTGDTVYALNKRAIKLNIKGRCIGHDSTKYYTLKQIEKIVSASKRTCKNHSRKIDIVELYLQGLNGRKIAAFLRISVKLAYDCLAEFNKTGCVTVESKISRIL